ncbi:MAG: GNAT family N-acetyltransferase [Candidatus Aminicenantes bacterium]|nr:GNAT family N-acetyltransferase [Candidatus Aminicenantes bacterium]
MAPEYQHKGYGIEAVSALVNFLLFSQKVDCVLARTVSDNRPSIRLLEKLGFSPDHDRPASFHIGDQSIPLVTFRHFGK